jgi:hypothetical protein
MPHIKRLRLRGALAAGMLALGLAGPAHGLDGRLIDASDPARVLALMQELGFTATLGQDQIGDPMITGTLGGARYAILSYGCAQQGACDSLQFVAVIEGVRLSFERANAYNLRWRYGRLSVTDTGDLVLKMDVNLDGGVTRANLADSLSLWAEVLATVRREVGLAPG